MLKNLKIENFRGFKSFELQKLGRINLLVGENNSGKTSILEAANILCSNSWIEPLADIMNYRGEQFKEAFDRDSDWDLEFTIQNLFYGRNLEPSQNFLIEADKNDRHQEYAALIMKISDDTLSNPMYRREVNLGNLELFICRKGENSDQNKIPLSLNDGLSRHLIVQAAQSTRYIWGNQKTSTQFIPPTSLTPNELARLFDDIVLTPQESTVVEALKVIDPNIERIATVGTHKYYRFNLGERGGFIVKRADSESPIPIGSFGDGVWRMLALALSMVNLEGGILLVDEIDSGLHFTAMQNMWKLVYETARKLNVQVFATTHSRDCWESLSALITQETTGGDDITIHRIEPGKSHSIIFNARQIAIAAERGIEIR